MHEQSYTGCDYYIFKFHYFIYSTKVTYFFVWSACIMWSTYAQKPHDVMHAWERALPDCTAACAINEVSNHCCITKNTCHRKMVLLIVFWNELALSPEWTSTRNSNFVVFARYTVDIIYKPIHNATLLGIHVLQNLSNNRLKPLISANWWLHWLPNTVFFIVYAC